MHPLKKEKEELKEIAKLIRTLKSHRKQNSQPVSDETKEAASKLAGIWYPSDRDHEVSAWKAFRLGQMYRLRHIAYCLARGRTIEQIEPTTRDAGGFEARYRNKKAEELKEKLQLDIDEWTKEKAHAI